MNVRILFINVLCLSFFLVSNSYAAPFLQETLTVPGKKNTVFFTADFNQDGALDFFFSGFDGQVNSSRIQWQKNGRFSANNYKSLPVSGSVENALARDLDLDGVLELLLSEEINGKQQLKLIRKEGDQYVNVTSVLNTFSFDSLKIELCDFNFDAYPDLLVFGLNNNFSEVILLENNGKGSFWTKNLNLPNNPGLSYVFRQKEAGELLWSSNNKTSSYRISVEGEVEEQTTVFPFMEGELEWVDVNGDGESELFVNGFLDEAPFKGILDVQFQESGFQFPFSEIKEVHWVDVNDDDLLDAVVNGTHQSLETGLFYLPNNGNSFDVAEKVAAYTSASTTLFRENGGLRLLVSSVMEDGGEEEYQMQQFLLSENAGTLSFQTTTINHTITGSEVALSWAPLTGNPIHINYRFGLRGSNGDSLLISSSEVNAYSDWKEENITFNLDSGNYTFYVQAFDLQGNKSDVLEHSFQLENAKTSAGLFRSVYLNNAFGLVENSQAELIDSDNDGDLDLFYSGVNGQLSLGLQESMNVFSEENLTSGQNLKVSSYSGQTASVYFEQDGQLWNYNLTENTSDSLGISFIEEYVLLDADKDGDLDVFLDSKQTQSSLLFYNEEGSFQRSLIPFENKNSPWLVADLDNNGYDDIITQEENNKNRVAWNNGKTFRWANLNTNPEYELLSLVDYQGDKDWDFLCYSITEQLYFVLVNEDGVFSTSTSNEIYTEGWQDKLFSNRNILIHLLNVDEDPALEVLYMDSNKIKVYDDSPTGYYSTILWEEDHSLSLSNQRPVKLVRQGDLNKDGSTDVFIQVSLSNGESQSLILYGTQKVKSTSSEINTATTSEYNNLTLDWESVTQASHYVIDLYSEEEVLLSSGIVNGNSTFANAFHSLDTTQTYYNLLSGKYFWQVHAMQKDILLASSAVDSFEVSSYDPVLIKSISEINPNNNPGGVIFSRPCDLDNDGDLDFLFLGTRGDTAGSPNFIANNFIYINQGDSTFVTKRISIDDLYTADVEYLDFNKDGYQDIVVTAAGISLMNTHWEEYEQDSGAVNFFTKIYLNDRNHNFYDSGVELPKIGLGKVEVADYNLDGLDDLLISGRDSVILGRIIDSDGEVTVRVDKGKGERNWYTILATNQGDSFTFDTMYTSKRNITAYFQDTDNDNDADILLLGGDYTNQTSHSLQFVNENGNGKENFDSLSTLIQGYAITYTDYGDYDRDGDLDLLVLGANVNNYQYHATRSFVDEPVKWNLSIYKNQGNNLFVPVSQNIEAYIPSTFIHQIHWLDINNDGILDIVLQQDNQIFMVEQTSTGTFVQAKSMHIKDDFTFSTYGDFNNNSRIDFAIGGREDPFKIYFSKIEAENAAPQTASGLQAEINNDACSLSWKNNGDDLTPASSLRYGVVLKMGDSLVYSSVNAASEAVEDYKNGLIHPSFKLKNLKDGEYEWQIAVIDDNYRASPLTLKETFTINHFPKISGAEDTCQYVATTYRVQPENQNYLWHVDTSVVNALDSLTASKIQLEWKMTGEHYLVVKNQNFEKWDTLWVNVRENERPVFSAELENETSKTKMRFKALNQQPIHTWNWKFIEQDSVVTDSSPVFDFQLPEKYPVGLEVVYQNACANYSEREVLVRSPKIFGKDSLCLGEIAQYEVFPAEFRYQWSVSGGEIVSRDRNKIEVAWDSDSLGTLWVTNQDLLEDGLLIDSMLVHFSDTGSSSFLIPENIGVNAQVEFVNTSELGKDYTWEVNREAVSEEENLLYTFSQAGDYVISLNSVTANNCSTTSEQRITVTNKLELVIYNVITANQDGVNDVLFIENLERYPNNTVSFYNLSGRLIYQQESYNNNWSPNSNGEPLSQGSYICVVQVEGFNQVFKQTVSVLY